MVAILTTILAIQATVAVAALHMILRHLTDRDTRADAERQELLQRIQAPELAVYQHDPAPTDQTQTFPLDDETLVELQDKERAQAIARVEKIESEMAVL